MLKFTENFLVVSFDSSAGVHKITFQTIVCEIWRRNQIFAKGSVKNKISKLKLYLFLVSVMAWSFLHSL